MWFKKMLLCLLPFVLFETYRIEAQTKNYNEEYKSGYRGGFIDGLTVPDSATSFLAMGDWGRCGEYFQKEVADQLGKASVSVDASFIISTGDNLYPDGVASTDDPLWNKSYEDIYHQFSLQKPWYVVLGNHDYITNPQAEVDYTKKSARWHMPQRYYSLKVPIKNGGGKQILFVFLDTSPLIDKYYADASYENNVKTQDTAAQMAWLKNTLSDADASIRWRFVVGHHPLFTSGKRIRSPETIQLRKRMKSIFDTYKVDAYICGHEHQQEYLTEGSTQYFISGSASEVRPVDDEYPGSKFRASDHAFEVFSVSLNQIQMQVINWEGKILYKDTINHL